MTPSELLQQLQHVGFNKQTTPVQTRVFLIQLGQSDKDGRLADEMKMKYKQTEEEDKHQDTGHVIRLGQHVLTMNRG